MAELSHRWEAYLAQLSSIQTRHDARLGEIGVPRSSWPGRRPS